MSDAAKGTVVRRLPWSTERLGRGRLSFTRDSRFLLSPFGEFTKVFDVGTGEKVAVLHGHRSTVNGIAVTDVPAAAGGPYQLVATGSRDGTVLLWRLLP